MIGVRLSVTAKDQHAPVRGGKLHVQHLHGGKLIEHRARGQPSGHRPQPPLERNVEAVGHKGDKDMRFDAVLKLVVNRPQLQIVF